LLGTAKLFYSAPDVRSRSIIVEIDSMSPSLSGVHPAIDSGVHPAIDSGVHPAIDSGVHPAIDSGVHPAIDSGVHPAIDSGVHPAIDSGVHPAIDKDTPGGVPVCKHGSLPAGVVWEMPSDGRAEGDGGLFPHFYLRRASVIEGIPEALHDASVLGGIPMAAAKKVFLLRWG